MNKMRFIIYNYVFLALRMTQVFCECGKSKLQGHNLIANGLPVERGTFPWHVGIYHIDWASRDIDHWCGGSLIAPDLVISAAHCFYIEADHRMGNAFDYTVAAGKIQRSYSVPENHTQISQVKSIHVPDGYESWGRKSTKDIAVLRLQTPFNMTDYVSPVCIDWRNTYTEAHLRHGNIGKVMGWGINAVWIPSEALQQIDLPHIPLNICIHGAPEDFLPDLQSDKICAGYLNGSSVCKGDSGGGHSFQSDGRWYLRGVVSTSAYPGNGTCNNNYYTAFTNVGHYLKWIAEFLHDAEERNSTTDSFTTGCSLPEQPERGRFEQHSSGKSSDHAAGSRVPIDSVLIYRCNEGYTLRGNDFSICKDEGWTPLPTCVKRCPALRLANGDVLCEYNGEIVPCELAMAPGTRATLECNDYYKLSPASKKVTCLEEGVWTSPGFQCVPECGIAESMETPLIVNGSQVVHGRFPWHVSIRYTDGIRSAFAGSLIRPDLVLSRAESVYDQIREKADDSVDYVVSAGKYYSSSDKSEPYAQTSSVKKIYIHSNYSGDRGYNAYDIALLRLATPFIMSKLVRPVCFDRRFGIAEAFPEVGKMLGWNLHNTYFEVEGRFVNRASCLSSVGSWSHKYLTSDKSCWQSTANENLKITSFPRLGGIYAEKNNTWYLVGFPNPYSLFVNNTIFSTNVDILISFILKVERD